MKCKCTKHSRELLALFFECFFQDLGQYIFWRGTEAKKPMDQEISLQNRKLNYSVL